MKFLCISDMHLSSENPGARLDNLVEVQFSKLKFVLKLAQEEGAVILQAGDMFHKPRSWMLLPSVIDLLRKYNTPIYGVFGQHDTYFYSTETRDRTNLGILVKVGLVIPLAVDNPTMVQGVALYGANFGQNLDDIKRSSKTAYSIGVIHSTISDVALWPGREFSAADKFLKDHPGYDFILVGDIHRQFEVAEGKRRLINTGPMLRREATEYNFQHKPSVYIFNTTDNTREWVEIPHAKAESVLSRDHIERQEEAETLLDDFVKAIGAEDVEMGVSFIDNLMAFAKENKVDSGVMDVIAKFIERTRRQEL